MSEVSICIPTYNRSSLLVRAVESARRQTVSGVEIVICDNASSDETRDVVASLSASDTRIRYVRSETNLGMVANWNRCIAEAAGSTMCVLNDDDCLAEEAVETAAALRTRFPDAAMVFGAVRHVREGRCRRVNRAYGRVELLSRERAYSAIWSRNCLQLSHAFFDVDRARSIGGFCDDVGWCADTDFVLRMAFNWPIAFTPRVMGDYHIHGRQLTGSANCEVHRWQRVMFERALRNTAGAPRLNAVCRSRGRQYLARYAIHFAAVALRREREDEAREFLLVARKYGNPGTVGHRLLRATVAGTVGTAPGRLLFRNAIAPVLARLASRVG